MISIANAIESGAWFKVHHSPVDEDENDLNYGLDIAFKLKLTEFSKINLRDVDQPEELSCSLDSNVWVLKFDIINLCKKGLSIYDIIRNIRLCDAEGYEFGFLQDDHLRLRSYYADGQGMSGFIAGELPPLISRKGAIPFELPEEVGDMFVKFEGDSIKEIGDVYRYFHDEKNKMLYRCSKQPSVLNSLYRGKVVGWTMRLEVDVVRPDNWLEAPNRWHFQQFEPYFDNFDALRYSRDSAISMFMMKALPLSRGAVEIDAQSYGRIESEYMAILNEKAKNR